MAEDMIVVVVVGELVGKEGERVRAEGSSIAEQVGRSSTSQEEKSSSDLICCIRF